ncbi:FtsQ-type POTRA domain-containing protein [Microbacterium sp. ZXX196]|uniref:FtsQ-type POTRA domain-containing protein n=1 Tax=Microbacterium sp. ZXX196 TaxID=2609291 RepID=UPI0012B77DBF|nr:FtsQ-type POTRA domain-containing protein [Microbacterium sp. ZXX196]
MKRPGPLPPSERREVPDPLPRAGAEDTARAHEGIDDARGAGSPPFGARWAERVRLWFADRRAKNAERSEVRRFTVRARRRRLTWIVSLGAFAALVVGTFGAAYSPLFAVEDIRVAGADTVSADDVAEALSDQVGRPLPLVDHSEIRAALLAFPRIETYTVESLPPHELVVRIVERTPVAVVASDAGFTTVDAAGVPLTTSDEAPEGLPIAEVEGGVASDAFAAVGQVLRALPADLAERVTRIRATSPEDVSFDLPDGGGVTVVWGSSGDTAEKVKVLEAGMASSPPADVSTYDVSSAGVLVVS